jgi:hypothetical protein
VSLPPLSDRCPDDALAPDQGRRRVVECQVRARRALARQRQAVKQSAVLRRCSRPDPSTQSGNCSLSPAQGVWPRQGQWETKLLDAVGAVARVSGAQALDAGEVLDAGNRGRGTRGQAPRRCRGLAVLKHSTPVELDAAQAGSAMRRCAASKAKGRGSSCRGSERGSSRSTTCNHHCTGVQGPRRCRGHVKLDAKWVLDALSSTVQASPHGDGSAVPSRREPTCSLAMRQPTCLTTGQLRRELLSRRKPSTARASLARLSAGAKATPQAQVKLDTGLS